VSIRANSSAGRWLAGVAAALVVLLTIGFAARAPLLRSVGRLLVADDPPGRADVIVVAVDAGEAGALEAADLVAAGVSSRVAVFATPDDRADAEFVRRGLTPSNDGAYAVRRLELLGVASAELIPIRVEGSTEQPPALDRWCAERGPFASALVVTNRDHSRRVRRVMRRGAVTHCGRVSVRGSRYSDFDPQDWWQERSKTRTFFEETAKLLVDVAMHPFS
jgi:hypothetical protein